MGKVLHYRGTISPWRCT